MRSISPGIRRLLLLIHSASVWFHGVARFVPPVPFIERRDGEKEEKLENKPCTIVGMNGGDKRPNRKEMI